MVKTADLYVSLSSPSPGQYEVELRYSQPEETNLKDSLSGPAVFPFEGLRAANLQPAVYGDLLRQAVFGDERDKRGIFYERALSNAQGAGQELRLLIQIDASASPLHNLRWETLVDPRSIGSPRGAAFIATNANRPFSRFMACREWQKIELPSPSHLRALVFIANPSDLQGGLELVGGVLHPVDVPGEIQRAREGLHDYPLSRGVPRLPEIEVVESRTEQPGRASLDTLKKYLNQGYDILYLVCHGVLMTSEQDMSIQHPHLILEKEDGTFHWCEGEEMAAFIGNLPVELRPRLIVLAACQSGGKGQVPGETAHNEQQSYDHGALAALGPRLVEAGVPAVVAQQHDIRMHTMKKFTPAFFTELLRSGQVDKAMAMARNIIGGEADWWVPVLYTCLEGGRIFPGVETAEIDRGQRAGRGFQAIAQAMGNPRVREAVIAYKIQFQDAKRQIEIIDLNKKLHEGFQVLEIDYPLIKAGCKSVLVDEDAWLDVGLQVGSVISKIDGIIEIVGEGHELIDPPLWLADLEGIKTGLLTAVEEQAQERLKRAADRLHRVLNKEITRINHNLVILARSLHLESIVLAMGAIRDKMVTLDADAQITDQVDEEIEDMQALSSRLAFLVKNHDMWQVLDDNLRLGEVNLEDALDEFLEDTWPKVKSLGISLYQDQDSPWAVTMKSQETKIDESLSALTDEQIEVDFQRFRESRNQRFREEDERLRNFRKQLQKIGSDFQRFCLSSRQRFRKVDKELLELCQQLQQIGNNMQIIIRFFDE